MNKKGNFNRKKDFPRSSMTPSFAPDLSDIINLTKTRDNSIEKKCKSCKGFSKKQCNQCFIGVLDSSKNKNNSAIVDDLLSEITILGRSTAQTQLGLSTDGKAGQIQSMLDDNTSNANNDAVNSVNSPNEYNDSSFVFDGEIRDSRQGFKLGCLDYCDSQICSIPVRKCGDDPGKNNSSWEEILMSIFRSEKVTYIDQNNYKKLDMTKLDSFDESKVPIKCKCRDGFKCCSLSSDCSNVKRNISCDLKCGKKKLPKYLS